MRGDPSLPPGPLYSASFVREKGPAWVLLPAQREADFRDSLAAWAARGYRPSRIAALAAEGEGENAAGVFTAFLEKDSTATLTRLGLDRAAFQSLSDSAQRNRSKCLWVDAYGTPDQPRFAAIWTGNNGGPAWNYSFGDDETSLHTKMEAFSRVWVRPALIAPLPNGKYLTLWEENSIGPWAAHARLGEDQASGSLEREAAAGMHPLSLQAIPGPALQGARAQAQGPGRGFTVLLARRSAPFPREWTITGPKVPGLESFDAYVRGLMKAHGVRAGALAVARDGKLVFSHGYTWAEPGYPETAPNSLFRVASCSKPLTSILVHRMLREGDGAESGPSLKEKILSLLHPTGRNGAEEAPADPRFREVTVDQLLTHSGGWVRSRQNPDPVFNDFPPGSDIRKRLPASRDDFLKYMLGQPLQYDPGSRSVYDNFGFFLLGRMLESLPMGAGRSYQAMTEEMLFRPLGLSRPRFGGSRFEERAPGEVLYHTSIPYLQANPHPGNGAEPWVPGGYGDFDLKNMDAAGAWLLSAPDYAKVLAAFDLGGDNPVLNPKGVGTMWGPSGFDGFLRGWFALKLPLANGDTAVAKWHNGLFPGTSTLVFYHPDKWSFALFLNRDLHPQPNGKKEGRDFSRLADGIKQWPEIDLFPEMGIPGFAAPGDRTARAGR